MSLTIYVRINILATENMKNCLKKLLSFWVTKDPSDIFPWYKGNLFVEFDINRSMDVFGRTTIFFLSLSLSQSSRLALSNLTTITNQTIKFQKKYYWSIRCPLWYTCLEDEIFKSYTRSLLKPINNASLKIVDISLNPCYGKYMIAYASSHINISNTRFILDKQNSKSWITEMCNCNTSPSFSVQRECARS